MPVGNRELLDKYNLRKLRKSYRSKNLSKGASDTLFR